MNSLAGALGLSSGAIKDACEQAAIDPKRRPETLSAHEFLSLAGLVRRQTLTGNRL